MVHKVVPLAGDAPLDAHLCFALYRSRQPHDANCSVPFLRKLGVTYPQYLRARGFVGARSPRGRRSGRGAGMDFGTLSPMLKRVERKGLIVRRRDAADERRVMVSRRPKGVALRKSTQQMLGEFYCFLNVPWNELEDLRDRLRRFVRSAGPTQLRAA
jgi:DNA-binding MarR family transcriptional regulator